MSALGHYLEDEGIPTVQISLVREHTEALSPPRALWVPFMLGRPFGAPGDAALQTRVLRAALALLERSGGPVLEDFPEEAPRVDAEEDLGGLVCPVAFPVAPDAGSPTERLRSEAAQLEPWHALALRLRGRTTLGVTGLSVDALATTLGAWTEGGELRSFSPDLATADAVRLACDELRAFYCEAKSVQPGSRGGDEIMRWFWCDTAAGAAIRALRNRVGRHDDPAVKALAASGLVPRAIDELAAG